MAAQISEKKNPNRLSNLFPIIMVVVAVLYAAAGYGLLLRPKLNAIAQGGGLDTSQVESTIEEDKAYSRRLTQGNEAFAALNPQRIEKVNNIIPTEAAVQNIFVILDGIAKRNNMVLVSVDSAVDDRAVTPDGRKTVRVSANVGGGNYEQFKTLLTDLETSERVFDVQSIIFVPNTATYSLVLRAYYLDPNVQAAPAGVAIIE